MEVAYDPSVFDIGNVDEAKAIILTPEPGQDTEDRWHFETNYLVAKLRGMYALNEKSIVLDYGCGLGRLSKPLIEQTGCYVIGVDIGTNMRTLANYYVGSDKFVAVHPKVLYELIVRGLRVDLALSVWVLQHCFPVRQDIDLIRKSLGPLGQLFVVNELEMRIPAGGQWIDDGVSVKDILEKQFKVRREGKLDNTVVAPETAARTFWASYSF